MSIEHKGGKRSSREANHLSYRETEQATGLVRAVFGERQSFTLSDLAERIPFFQGDRERARDWVHGLPPDFLRLDLTSGGGWFLPPEDPSVKERKMAEAKQQAELEAKAKRGEGYEEARAEYRQFTQARAAAEKARRQEAKRLAERQRLEQKQERKADREAREAKAASLIRELSAKRKKKAPEEKQAVALGTPTTIKGFGPLVTGEQREMRYRLLELKGQLVDLRTTEGLCSGRI